MECRANIKKEVFYIPISAAARCSVRESGPMPRVAEDAKGERGGSGLGGRFLASDMLPFAAARTIVRKLKLKGVEEWYVWRKSGQRSSNIPSLPSKTYRDDGWISMPDWLGYEGQARGNMP